MLLSTFVPKYDFKSYVNIKNRIMVLFRFQFYFFNSFMYLIAFSHLKHNEYLFFPYNLETLLFIIKFIIIIFLPNLLYFYE